MRQVFETYEEAFYGMLQNVMDYGNTVTVRDMETKELMHASFTILHPQYRLNLLKHRNGNPFAQIAETMWMLAGRNDLDWLEKYIPQCKKWSDDGKTWRAAYGPRLRNWADHIGDGYYDYTDQVQQVINLLQRDPETRQAVISLFDPAKDWVEGSKDYPCNNWLHFMIRDGKLHLNVAVRSNDIMYGFSHADFYGWSVLQQLVAHLVDVEVGKMTWNASSLHIYGKHYDMATKILQDNSCINDIQYAFPHMTGRDMEGIDSLLYDFFAQEDSYTHGDASLPNINTSDSWFGAANHMMYMYHHYQTYIKNETDMTMRIMYTRQLAHHVSVVDKTDMKYAAIEYFCHHIPGFAGVLELSNDEFTWLHKYDVV